MCEDYRAGLRADRAHEEADRSAGRKIQCPMLLLVSAEDKLDFHGGPEAIWRPWTAGGLRSRRIAARVRRAYARVAGRCLQAGGRAL
jgi:haloacetate dehalogenase